MKPLTVTITEPEQLQITIVGIFRQGDSVGRGLKDGKGASHDYGAERNILGAQGEYVVSKVLNLHWPLDTGRFGLPDVGPYHVKTTDCACTPHLVLSPKEARDAIYILVQKDASRDFTYLVWGWTNGQKSIRDEFLKPGNGRPDAYWIPISELEPIDTLTFPGPIE
jgi:hypothetical protein